MKPPDEGTFALHNRRLRFITHPDAERGEYVLVAGYGIGQTTILGAAHEIHLCLDEAKRQELIALLQGDPEDCG